MSRPKSDPLLAALIAKLPPSGTKWPIEKQIGWLKLMAMAFETIYGGEAFVRVQGVGAREIKNRWDDLAPDPLPTPTPPKPAPPKYPFIIDTDNYVRRGIGARARVRPDEVTDIIYDLRGLDGDMKTMVWADDSMGLNGRDLTIAVG